MLHRAPLSLLLVSSLVFAPACGNKDSKDSNDNKTSTSPAAESVSKPLPLPSADLKKSLGAVPADVTAVASLAIPVSLSDMEDGFGFLAMDPALAKEMQSALIDHSKKHMGIDVSKVRSAVVFVNDGGDVPTGALVCSPVEGEMLDSAPGADGVRMAMLFPDALGGRDVVAAQVDKTLIIGDEASVKRSVAAFQGEQKSLAKADSAFASYVREKAQKSYFSVAADLAQLLPSAPMTQDLSFVAVNFGTQEIEFSLHGKEEGLEQLKVMAKGALVVGMNQAKQAMERSSDDFAEGAGTILVYYMIKHAVTLFEPKINGGSMTLNFSFEGVSTTTPMILVSISGVLAAVAIPAFMKYIKKSKTAEAHQFLFKLHDGVRRSVAEGKPLPASVGPTPPLGACCEMGDKCVPDAAQWQHPTWEELSFAIHDPHYFSYEVINNGDVLVLKAYGDLDCDGVYSTFTVQTDETGSRSIFKENELE